MSTRAKPKLVVKSFMSVGPHSIGRDQTLHTAHQRMRQFQLRHLPVLDGGKLVGMLSDRDLYFLETLKGVDPMQVTVEEAMTTNVYAVEPDASLEEVAANMAEHKYGSAVVLEHAHVVGVFTTTDALRALVQVLRAPA